MNLNFSLDKFIEAIGVVELSTWHVIFAFFSSFNLWFLEIYFFRPDIYELHGAIITILLALGLCVPWCLITSISVSYSFRMGAYLQNPKGIDVEDEKYKRAKNTSAFSEILVLHGIFFLLAYYTKIDLPLLTVFQFLTVFVQALFFFWLSFRQNTAR